MKLPFLLSRVLLHFNSSDTKLLDNVSSVTFTPDGSMWLGSDELATLERLSRIEPYIYGEHQSFAIANFINLPTPDGEVDIEGLDYSKPYLWFTGSHSPKRKKISGKKIGKAIQNLATVEVEANRYLLGRIPVVDGELFQSCSHPDRPSQTLTAACLKHSQTGNMLTDALQTDPHLGVYMNLQLASKENGFDIEGLAVRGNRIFLGLRGPVLRGWAILLEIEVEESEPGVLTLKPINEDGHLYKKHFVNLKGLGVRELCWYKDHLLILAGPTMALEGEMQVLKLKNVLERSHNSITDYDTDDLKILFNLPSTIGSDHAEGLALCSCLEQSNALFVAYDSPDQARKVGSKSMYADIFKLK